MAADIVEETALIPCTIKTMAEEQIDQIIRWYAAGHSPRDIVQLAQTEFNLIIEEVEARLLWTTHTTEIADAVRMSLASMRQSPYYEPAFVVAKLNMLAFHLEEMMGAAIDEGASGPATKLVETWLRVITRIDTYQPADGSTDVAGSSNFATVIERMEPLDQEKVKRLLGQVNDVVDQYRNRTEG